MTRNGAGVIKYDGARGVVWKIKYRDADGQQVKETLGRADAGWTVARARAELEARLTDVRREGLRKPNAMSFAAYCEKWFSTYPDAKGLKKSTRQSYRLLIDGHFAPSLLGSVPLGELTGDHIEAYVAAKRRAGLSPVTVNRHLNLLHRILKTAVKRKLIRSNPVDEVERQEEGRRRWTILGPADVARVDQAFRDLIGESEGEERTWREQARCIFIAIYGTGMRRGEILGLRWRNVFLADPEGARLRVIETWVRNAIDTPKSAASERTISLGPVLADALFEHRARTAYGRDDERVFCSPTKGTPFDTDRYSKTFKLALAKAKVEGRVRPFHDGRHSAITNAAAAGNAPTAIQARAGHANFGTTQLYIDLAGEAFRHEAEEAEARMFGPNGYQEWVPSSDETPVERKA